VHFEWDPEKAAMNLSQHGVSFQEAATVLADPLSLTFDDPDHSSYEQRYLTAGLSAQGRHLIVAHTDRSGRIRIISARELTKRERKFFEEGG
jgi:uncharacterized DUF497 family protein